MRRDRRSAAALRYRGLYRLPDWARARAAQLGRQPWCERCASQGRQVSATVAEVESLIGSVLGQDETKGQSETRFGGSEAAELEALRRGD